MNNIISGMLTATLSVSFAAAAVIPANATFFYVPQVEWASSDVQAVGDRRGDAQWIRRHGDPRNFNRNVRNRNFSVDRNFARNNNGAYWNGHRGYSDYHRGYRRQGDYWFPLAAFATGALITGAIINNNQNRVYAGDSHVQWCHDRYRSYRASDNTFQPYYGPRQQCNSPF